ncbi:MAG: signal peptide peptidase SppA [Chloroflexota bacterium]
MLVLPQLADMPWNKPRIAVLEIAGGIGPQVKGPETVRTIKALREDPRVNAVIIDIDSPGGSATISDAIFRGLQKLSAKKPTVAYVGNVALSGGYLAACGARKVVALPTALVGSIGVIFSRPVVEELMQKVGVKMVVTHEGRLKGMFQPWHDPTPEEQEKVQALTDEYYEWFVGSVSQARGLSLEKVKEIATGEMYSASKGLTLGLVDELGDFERATELAKELAKMTETPRLNYIRPKRPLLERVLQRAGASMAESFFSEAETRARGRIEFR